MDQLIQMVKERANLDEHATAVVNTVVGFLKDRLPDPIAGRSTA